jgi:hypothetical protein
MRFTEDDLEEILLLKEYFPKLPTDDLCQLHKNFVSSGYNRPECDLDECIKNYLKHLIWN